MSNKKYKCIREYPFGPPIGTITHIAKNVYGYGVIESYSEFWEEIKEKPLFTTEDGVEIFKGDDYWQVIPEFRHYFIGNNDYERRSCDKHFSTEKAAKDYIEMNKPMYSKKQIMDAALVKYVTGTILLHIKDIK